MGRLEVCCRRFALASGVEQSPEDFAVCIRPADASLHRKGLLAVITEPYGDAAMLSIDACRLAQQVLVDRYFADNSLSMTTSLLNALDQANNALLQQNYAPERLAGDGTYGPSPGPRSSVSRSKRARVGVTAVISRPDGTGIYLSQLAPTQAYLFHNGAVMPLPEPPGWQQHKRPVVVLRRVGEDEDEQDEEWGADEVPVLDAPPLGSGPGVLADLVFRRVEPGDIIVLASTGLTRHINKEWADDTIAHSDPDSIVNAMHGLAMRHGLAEAHGMVIQLGVAASSGVDEEYSAPVPPPAARRVADNGGIHAVPPLEQEPSAGPAFIETLRSSSDWLSKLREEAGEETDAGEEHPYMEAPELELVQAEAPATEGEFEDEDSDLEFRWSPQPTGLFVQTEPPIPPYLSGLVDEEYPRPVEQPNLEFDGWEDNLPNDIEQSVHDYPEQLEPTTPEAAYEGLPEPPVPFHAVPRPVRAVEHSLPPTPRLFEDDAFVEMRGAEVAEPTQTPAARFQLPRISLPALPHVDAGAVLRRAAAWAASTGRALVPANRSALTLPKLGGHTFPLRVVIVAALAVVVLALVFSVATMAGGAKKQANENLLVVAQQLETEANQPGITAAERREKLGSALSKAQQALASNPKSEESTLLVGKLQTDLDRLDGITRLTGVKELFSFEPAAEDGSAARPAAAAVSSTLPVQDIVVQSNDLYVLDRTANRVFRCQVSTRACAATLSGGDTAGGEKVGVIQHIALRVGSPVVLDDRMVSYVLDPANGAWQAQPLGDAGSLQKPKDIGTYDGNLYLLDARPGQVSKYQAGQYGSPPADWIRADAGAKGLENPVAMAIDGAIYVLQADGKIVVMQAGQATLTITPSVPAATTGPTDLFTDTDVRDLYLFRAEDGLITRVSKEGKTLGSFKAPAGMNLDRLSGFSVDEARGRVYMVQGTKVYEGAFATPKATQTDSAKSNTAAPAIQENTSPATQDDTSGSPSARPTVEP